MNSKNPILRVYSTPISENPEIKTLIPEARNKEILECKSQKVKLEKYSGWILLEKAIKETFNLNMNEVDFKKEESGKWSCNKFYFSISHSCGMVFAAVSNCPVGIDAEAVKHFEEKNYDILALKQKLLNDEEKLKYSALVSKRDFLQLWTKKEAAFKAAPDAKGFYSRQIILDETKLNSMYRFFGNKEYCISVCSEIADKLIFV